MQGKLFLATLFTIGGGADRPYLWIKSDGAQYEIVLTEKTSLPSDWRQKRDGDDTQYPVTLIGVGGTFYTEPDGAPVQRSFAAGTVGIDVGIVCDQQLSQLPVARARRVRKPLHANVGQALSPANRFFSQLLRLSKETSSRSHHRNQRRRVS